MPAKVTIQSGISAGTSHWIEEAVVRIGSDPRSDVCLPSADVESHALTLEFRGGQYRVYNRCRSNVFLGTRIIEPGKVLVWDDTDILQLSGGIELVLDLDEDPAPMPVRTVAAQEEEAWADHEQEMEHALPVTPAESVQVEKADNSKFVMQLGVTVLCVLGCVALLVRESMKQPDGAKRTAPSFAAVVRNANASATSPELVQLLQYAESAAIRGNKKSARQRYGALRDDLVPQQEVFETEGRKPELAILDFVEYRLGQLD